MSKPEAKTSGILFLASHRLLRQDVIGHFLRLFHIL